MTHVDFYIIEQGGGDGCWRFACRLTEQAYRQGGRVYLHVGSPEEAARLDDLLWSFRAGSFIPHGRGEQGDPDTRVHIGWGEEPLDHHDLLINLTVKVPPFFSRFERVAELVDDGDEESKQHGRQRFRFYRDRGYPLQSQREKAEPAGRDD